MTESVPSAEQCWHKEIDDNGICKACGAKAAITLPFTPEAFRKGLSASQSESMGLLRIQNEIDEAKANFKKSEELKTGLASVGIDWIEPTELRNRAGKLMLDSAVKIGVKIDPAEVQSLLVEFAQGCVSAAVAEERERCAKIVENLIPHLPTSRRVIAKAIREEKK